MKTNAFSKLVVGMLFLCLAVPASADLPGLAHDFTFKKADGSVQVYRKGKLFTSYIYKDTTAPYLTTLYSANGIRVSPTDASARSLWIGLGNIDDFDFWSGGKKNSGKVSQSQLDFRGFSSDADCIHASDYWIGPDGKTACCDEKRIFFASCNYGIIVANMISISACQHDVVFNDTRAGFLGLHLDPALQFKTGTGHILDSAGHKDAACLKDRVQWCDFTGEIDGKNVGVAVFDAPTNYNHPGYLEITKGGVYALNPFAGKALTGKAKNDSTLRLPLESTITFRYAVLIHDGKLDSASLNEICNQLVGVGPAKSQSTIPEPPKKQRARSKPRRK